MLIAALAALPGSVLITIAALAWAYRTRFRATARRVEGIVVRHDFRVTRTRRGYGGRHYPVVAYEVDGARFEHVSGVGQTSERYRKGTRIDVLFSTDPRRAVLDATLDLHFYAILFAILGVLATLLGLWLVFVQGVR